MRKNFDTIHTILHFTGLILVILGFLLLLPLIFVFLYREPADGLKTVYAFVIPSLAALALGFLLNRLFREGHTYTLRAVLICSVSWTVCSAVGALPFVLGAGVNYLDAYFETMSGFTTTGFTIFSNLDGMPASLLFWRGLTQWLGGLGILGFFLATGFKGKNAHALYSAESHKISVDRPVPGLYNTVKILWSIYIGFTAVIFFGLLAAGMPAFEGLCHSLSVLATGGFSPHDASIGYYRLNGYSHYILIEYIVIIGMFLGGINFLVHYQVFTGRLSNLFRRAEMKYWWGIVALATGIILLEIYFKSGRGNGYSLLAPGSWKGLEENFRITIFQVTSILTTTGFITRDIGSPFFGQTARLLFLLLMFVGGCVGSTSGGFKIYRVVILRHLLGREMFRLRAPREAISTVVIDGTPVDINEIQRVSGIFFAWIALILLGGIITALLSAYGSLASISGMLSAVSNIGPCYIPSAEIAQLNPLIKLVYIFGMLAGRLEILPVLMMLNLRAWSY
ncbi:MAG: TrkH family potassium uptake protein [Candidatus Krumholzibacteriota bacterium]|nr:TrkH family potassium uptake protein [Candidatus Krumholzibacteriota bacterium]